MAAPRGRRSPPVYFPDNAVQANVSVLPPAKPPHLKCRVGVEGSLLLESLAYVEDDRAHSGAPSHYMAFIHNKGVIRLMRVFRDRTLDGIDGIDAGLAQTFNLFPAR